jgi:light-regulated signal transduction histidine kinase (bacteriophytochrome)
MRVLVPACDIDGKPELAEARNCFRFLYSLKGPLIVQISPTHTDARDTAVTAANVVLSNCDRELIHIPGMIQPHGAMLVLRAADQTILQASSNTAGLFGISAASLTGRTLDAMLGQDQAAGVMAAVADLAGRLDSGPLLALPRVTAAAASGAVFNVLGHRTEDGSLILEFERIADGGTSPEALYSDLAAAIGRLQSASDLRRFLDLAVRETRALTGFDRVMAYQFATDGSGQVVAEARRDDLNAYAGMHFPAADIPAPARRLFALSWLRHLPDVGYAPVRLLPDIAEPVDMSRSLLRHVSVMYTGYLKNMQAGATMVLPLMKAGKLWGLMSCMHHAGPLHVPATTRTAVEILAHAVSLTMAEREDHDTAAYRGRMDDAIAALGRQMTNEPIHERGLHTGPVSVHGWLDATGAAVLTADGVVLLGDTPRQQDVEGIADWLMTEPAAGPESGTVFATDSLAARYPAADAFRATASGLLSVQLTEGRREFVMWFRPEITRTVEWAGDPRKPVQVDVVDGEERLTPRTSFDIWRQSVRGTSAAWLDCEIGAADALRRMIADIALVRLNDNLQRSNAELDAFAYVASHDLKEPLRGISNFARFLQRSADPKLTEEERGRIETILRMTRRMDDLIDALLLYSRVGRSELVLEAVDLNAVLRQVLDGLELRIAEANVEIRLPHPLPVVKTDRIRIGEVLTNLVTNAIKYNDRETGEKWIEIGWMAERGQPVFHVRDNGLGIAPQHLDQIFQIFRRLHGRDDYGGGNGVGLTISRRTIDRLGGRLWVESDGPGEGSTFRFTLGGAGCGLSNP